MDEPKPEDDEPKPVPQLPPKQYTDTQLTTTASMTSETILLRVKRPRNADDLEEIYLEYDNTCGTIKRTKMVTEKDHIQNALSMFTLGGEKKKDTGDLMQGSLLAKSLAQGDGGSSEVVANGGIGFALGQKV